MLTEKVYRWFHINLPETPTHAFEFNDINHGKVSRMQQGSPDTTEYPDNESEERYHELLVLSRVSAALSGLWDLDAILRVALENVLSIMNGNHN